MLLRVQVSFRGWVKVVAQGVRCRSGVLGTGRVQVVARGFRVSLRGFRVSLRVRVRAGLMLVWVQGLRIT